MYIANSTESNLYTMHIQSKLLCNDGGVCLAVKKAKTKESISWNF